MKARTLTLLRAASVVLWAVAISAAAQATYAADATLGVAITPRVVTWESNARTIMITSLATVPVNVSVLIEDGEGWDIDTTEPFALQPKESHEVTVTAAGDGNARYVVTLSSADAAGSGDKTAVRLVGTPQHLEAPGPDLRWMLLVLAGLAGMVAVLFGMRWVKRHVKVTVR